MSRFAALLLCWLLWSPMGFASGYSASFQGVEVQEFINTVSKNLNKTVIIDPAVRGTITVRSYDSLNSEQYYQFFLNVLAVYGFAVVEEANGVLKVVKSKDAKIGSIPVIDAAAQAQGDEVVTRVVVLRNVSARDLAPLLRQLNDNAGVGNVVHYDPSNVLLMTGRAAVINRLMAIVERVDLAGDKTLQTIPLRYASASEVARLTTLMVQDPQKNGPPAGRIIADERTNSVLISGDARASQQLAEMVAHLDKPQANRGKTTVHYLKFANAEKMAEVLNGLQGRVVGEGGEAVASAESTTRIIADPQTNSLIITAALDAMSELEQVIARLDIRRPQVLVEAIIAEVQNADGLNLGVQWGNKYAGFTQYTETGLPITSFAAGVNQYRDKGTVPANLGGALSQYNGIAAGFLSGNWGMLLTALSSDSQNDILATPSIVTLDNKEATFNVGQEVPVLSGSQTTSGDNIFNTVERKTVGIKLKVKPQINEGDAVLLEIEQEVSSVAETASSASSSLGATFNTRTVNNAVLVSSGATVVVGGLLDHSSRKSSSKVPGLGDIPLVGKLFGANSTNSTKRNLMLFIRPTIIRDNDGFQRVSGNKYRQYQEDEGRAGSARLDLPELAPTKGGFQQVREGLMLFMQSDKGA